MKPKPPSIEDNPFSVLKLSVTRLMHIREVQATGGGHFAQVARELGYVQTPQPVSEEEMKWVEEQLAQADQVRKKRSDQLVERLKAARERLGVGSVAPARSPSMPPPASSPSMRPSLSPSLSPPPMRPSLAPPSLSPRSPSLSAPQHTPSAIPRG